MKKVICSLLVLFCIMCLTGCGKETKDTVFEKLTDKIESTKGYKIEAEMELINNEDSYKYDVTISYAKDDYFRVSLRNQSNNHEQIILKNDEGVYVQTHESTQQKN